MHLVISSYADDKIVLFVNTKKQKTDLKTGNLILPLNLLFLPLYWLGLGVGLGFVGQG